MEKMYIILIKIRTNKSIDEKYFLNQTTRRTTITRNQALYNTSKVLRYY